MAWTERYVRADAAGGGNGTTDTNSGANGAWTLAEGIANEAAGMRVNIKAGTYANTTTSRSWAAAGTITNRIWWRGFKTTPGDLDARPTSLRTVSTDMPHITWTTGNGETGSSSSDHTFSSISFLGTNISAMAPMRLRGSRNQLHRCRLENQSTGHSNQAGVWVDGSTILTECYIKAATTLGSACNLQGSNQHVIGCYIDAAGAGIAHGYTQLSIIGNIIDSPSLDAISVNTGDIYIVGNTIYNPGGHGIVIATSNGRVGFIINNLFHTVTGASKYGISIGATANHMIMRVANAYYNVTTPENGFGDSPDWDRITESSDPLTNPGSNDFSLKTSALSFQAGHPGLFEGLSIASYASVGAHIPDEVGGGGLRRASGMVGGFRG